MKPTNTQIERLKLNLIDIQEGKEIFEGVQSDILLMLKRKYKRVRTTTLREVNSEVVQALSAIEIAVEKLETYLKKCEEE